MLVIFSLIVSGLGCRGVYNAATRLLEYETLNFNWEARAGCIKWEHGCAPEENLAEDDVWLNRARQWKPHAIYRARDAETLARIRSVTVHRRSRSSLANAKLAITETPRLFVRTSSDSSGGGGSGAVTARSWGQAPAAGSGKSRTYGHAALVTNVRAWSEMCGTVRAC